MTYFLLLTVNLVLHQIPFETEALCEAAKKQLEQNNGISSKAMACVQVAT
jgi:hypothetical protein